MNTIKELRKTTGMSQNTFSDYLDIPVANIQHWEQGVTTPPDYVISLITRVMKSDGYLSDSLTAHQVNMIRQTQKTLELENMHISEESLHDLKHMASGTMSLDAYMENMRKRYAANK